MRSNRLRHKQDDTKMTRILDGFIDVCTIQISFTHCLLNPTKPVIFSVIPRPKSKYYIDFKKLPKLTQEKLVERLLDLFYTWLRTFKNLLLLKCIVLFKFRSFN